MMKPLIKWPGGKAAEISKFLQYVPEYERYIEPFAGGAALYFYLEPERAVLNDTSEDLMEFYMLLQSRDPELRENLILCRDTFAALLKECGMHSSHLRMLFDICVSADEKGDDLRPLALHEHLTREIAGHPSVLSRMIPDREAYLRIMTDSVGDKLFRTVRNHRKKPFPDKDIRDNLVTGFASGYYLYFRDVFNRIRSGALEETPAFRAANFYFVREYCYGSMFRYNRQGEFNIPYGGVSYNKKDFGAKIDRMYQDNVLSLFERTQFCCEDFETFTDRLELTEKDFMFLDPPYDTDFSDYEGKSFGKEDHIRLARLLDRTRAQFLLVIKNTGFISELYGDKFRIVHFDNRYSYNVRSRNDRDAEHLIITNIPEVKTQE